MKNEKREDLGLKREGFNTQFYSWLIKNNFPEVFQYTIRHLRKSKGLTQWDLARELQCTENYVWMMEAGHRIPLNPFRIYWAHLSMQSGNDGNVKGPCSDNRFSDKGRGYRKCLSDKVVDDISPGDGPGDVYEEEYERLNREAQARKLPW